jgi:tetratricopeptide (TPR) repeat protein
VALLERALTLNTGCASAWFWSGFVRVRAGETDAAIENLRTALRLDPLGPRQPQTMGHIGRALFQQGRFSEAVPLLKAFAQHVDSPMPQAYLAASYGHLGQASEAQAALARFRALSSQPLEAFAANWLRDPAQRKLFLDGIALDEGRGPAYVPTDVSGSPQTPELSPSTKRADSRFGSPDAEAAELARNRCWPTSALGRARKRTFDASESASRRQR